MAGLLSPLALPHGFTRHHESKLWRVSSNRCAPWPIMVLFSKLFLHPLPTRMVGFGTWSNKIQQSQLEETGSSPRQVLMDIPHWLKVSSLVSRTLQFSNSFSIGHVRVKSGSRDKGWHKNICLTVWWLLCTIIIVAYTLDWWHFSATEYFRNIKLTSAICVEYCLLQQVMCANIILLL